MILSIRNTTLDHYNVYQGNKSRLRTSYMVIEIKHIAPNDEMQVQRNNSIR